MSLGDLVVKLSADTATFRSDLGRATQQLNNFSRDARRALGALAGLGAGVSFTALIKGSVDAQDRLNDLSKQTGIAVTTIGGLGFAAGQAGGSLESITAAAGKLNKAIAEAAGGNKEFAEAFTAIGISIKDANGQLKSADAVLFELADSFEGFADGPEKVAIALKLLGKAGAENIPVLNEGGKKLREAVEYYRQYSGVTAESAARADDFNDTLGKLKIQTQGFTTDLVNRLLPALQTIADEFLRTSENTKGINTDFSALTETFKALTVFGANVAFVFKAVGVEVGGIAAQIAALLRLDFKGFSAIGKALKEDAAAARKEIDAFSEKVLTGTPTAARPGFNDRRDGSGPNPKVRAPVLKTGSSGSGAKDDPTKKILDNQLKLYEQQVAREKEILDSRNKFLDLFNAENLISLKDYYAGRRAAQEENVNDTVALYNKEIAALEKYRASAAKQTDKEEATGKINDLLEKKAKLQKSASEEAIVDSVKEQGAFRDLAREIQNVNAEILEFQGNLREAAVIRFDQQNEDLRKRFSAEGNTAALAQLDTLKRYTVAQSELNQIAQQAGIIQDQLANAETRIDIARNAGALSELGVLRSLSAERQKAVAELQALYDNYAAIAQASGNPKLIQDAENLRVQLERLRSESDLVRQKFDTIFSEGFSSAFSDFITGAKSAKDAFRSLADSVVQQISRMVAQDLAGKLFGGSGGSGGGFGSSIGGFFASLFGGGAAIGASVNPDSVYRVGETGPEMFVPNTAGRIVPISEQKGANDSRPVSVTVNVPQSTSRASADQIAAMTGMAVNRAVRRNT